MHVNLSYICRIDFTKSQTGKYDHDKKNLYFVLIFFDYFMSNIWILKNLSNQQL